MEVNVEKTKIFTSGMDKGVIENIKMEIGFKEGCLPVRYLGLPLLTMKFSVKDCKLLLQKLKDKVESWSSALLRYAGRVQLINAVLFSMQVFWSRHFLLPKKVLASIVQICSRFLWKVKLESARVQG